MHIYTSIYIYIPTHTYMQVNSSYHLIMILKNFIYFHLNFSYLYTGSSPYVHLNYSLKKEKSIELHKETKTMFAAEKYIYIITYINTYPIHAYKYIQIYTLNVHLYTSHTYIAFTYMYI